MAYTEDIRRYIELEREVLARLDIDAIDAALSLLVETRACKGRVYVFGNGGSAATASHFQNDFNKGVSAHTQEKFRFHCLNDNIATLMAIANDVSYDEVFRMQLEGVIEPNDIVLAISGSGNSNNVLLAVEYAKAHGCQVIGLTGYDGGKLGQICDIHLNAPVKSMQVAEDIHMVFDHLMMSVLYKHLCGIEHLSE